jgi:formylglycine-generating enzyme required for sulfatase activity
VSRAGRREAAYATGQLGEAGLSLPRAQRVIIRSNRDELYLERTTRPAWASAMGRDRFGLYADLSIAAKRTGDVVQRVRWIPPGRFRMGSPAGEEGRYDDEEPRHEVTIREGYWLFDTPCTQALWEAVMGGNPSEFKSPTRPVESVSFVVGEYNAPVLDAIAWYGGNSGVGFELDNGYDFK